MKLDERTTEMIQGLELLVKLYDECSTDESRESFFSEISSLTLLLANRFLSQTVATEIYSVLTRIRNSHRHGKKELICKQSRTLLITE